MTDTKELWRGDFGDEYTSRNSGGVRARAAVWQCFASVQEHEIGSVLEVGANKGLNLEILARLFPEIDLYACEPNDKARAELLRNLELPAQRVTTDFADSLSFGDDSIDLVFTQGVLIHVPPAKLESSLTEIHRVARRYVMFLEYFSPTEEMVKYRGLDNALWRRDYGDLFMGMFPDIKFLGCTFFWKRMTGLDNLTMWVFEKPQPIADLPAGGTRH